jgi:hypothetical protein
MELHPHRHEYRTIILSLFVALALISITLITHYQRSGLVRAPNAVKTQMPSTALILTPIPASEQTIVVNQDNVSEIFFSVVPKSVDKLVYRFGEPIALKIIGSTGGKKVVGYDVLLTGGKQAYDIVSVKSLLPEFTVLKFIKDDHLTVTAVLKPSVKTQTAFESTPFVEIVIKPKASGSLNLKILSKSGKETSKIITIGALGNSEKLYAGDSDNLRLDIKQ